MQGICKSTGYAQTLEVRIDSGKSFSAGRSDDDKNSTVCAMSPRVFVQEADVQRLCMFGTCGTLLDEDTLESRVFQWHR